MTAIRFDEKFRRIRASGNRSRAIGIVCLAPDTNRVSVSTREKRTLIEDEPRSITGTLKIKGESERRSGSGGREKK